VKAEWRGLGAFAAFIALLATIYWFMSYERAGSLLLATCAVSIVIFGAYLAGTSRRRAPLPEDRTDAVPEEGAGEVGVFAAASVWPPVIGLGAALAAYGLAFSGWLALPGMALALIGTVAAALR